MQESHRQIQTPLHPAGKRQDLIFGMIRKADLLQHDLRTQVNLFVRQSRHRAEETQVLAGGKRRVKRYRLWRVAEGQKRVAIRHFCAVNKNVARIAPQLPGDNPHQSGFPRAVGPQKRLNPAVENSQRKILQSTDRCPFIAECDRGNVQCVHALSFLTTLSRFLKKFSSSPAEISIKAPALAKVSSGLLRCLIIRADVTEKSRQASPMAVISCADFARSSEPNNPDASCRKAAYI